MKMATVKKPTLNTLNQEQLENTAQKLDEVASPLDKPKATETIIIHLPKQRKNEYKAFFATHGLNMSQGIKIAIEHLKNDIEHGKGKLTDIGYFG